MNKNISDTDPHTLNEEECLKIQWEKPLGKLCVENFEKMEYMLFALSSICKIIKSLSSKDKEILKNLKYKDELQDSSLLKGFKNAGEFLLSGLIPYKKDIYAIYPNMKEEFKKSIHVIRSSEYL